MAEPKTISTGRNIGHSHKWHIFDVKSAFIPIEVPEWNGQQLYERVEFAYGVCICGAVVKSFVEENPNAMEEMIDNGRDPKRPA